MLILKILDHDLHRARASAASKIPFSIMIPDKVGHFPVLVSSTRGKFIKRTKLVEGAHPCGIFPHDPDRHDEIIGPLFQAAYDLSVAEKWGNVLQTPSQAFGYVQKAAGTTVQPHACLVPSTWSNAVLKKWGGEDLIIGEGVESYKKTCRVYRCGVTVPVFVSRPDFVGLLTQFVGGLTSILLHNIQQGMAFCDPDGVPRKVS